MHEAGWEQERRAPGQYARASAQRLRMHTLVSLGALAITTALIGRAVGVQDVHFLAAEIALLSGMLTISRLVLPLVARRDRGASAEEHVGQLLEGLPAGPWRVIHDASIGHGNIDHIVIGCAGVFVLETKSHPGPVRVRRLHGGTLRQVNAQRRAIETSAGLSVEPLLVFSRAWVDRPLARRKGVRVVPARVLRQFLAEQPAVMSADQVELAHRGVLQALGALLGERDTGVR